MDVCRAERQSNVALLRSAISRHRPRTAVCELAGPKLLGDDPKIASDAVPDEDTSGRDAKLGAGCGPENVRNVRIDLLSQGPMMMLQFVHWSTVTFEQWSRAQILHPSHSSMMNCSPFSVPERHRPSFSALRVSVKVQACHRALSQQTNLAASTRCIQTDRASFVSPMSTPEELLSCFWVGHFDGPARVQRVKHEGELSAGAQDWTSGFEPQEPMCV